MRLMLSSRHYVIHGEHSRSPLETASFVCNHATRIENEKLRSEGVAMYAYGVSVYYA